jgi:UDP-N-acetylglucosamine 2-epimerase
VVISLDDVSHKENLKNKPTGPIKRTKLDLTIDQIAKEENMEVIVIYPNAYPGGYRIIEVIREYKLAYGNIHLFENMPHLDYISLMSLSSVLVGNSSSGIIEAPSLGLPEPVPDRLEERVVPLLKGKDKVRAENHTDLLHFQTIDRVVIG